MSCIHVQANQLRFDFLWHPYVPGRLGWYQQFVRQDVLTMALKSGPIPDCTEACQSLNDTHRTAEAGGKAVAPLIDPKPRTR